MLLTELAPVLLYALIGVPTQTLVAFRLGSISAMYTRLLLLLGAVVFAIRTERWWQCVTIFTGSIAIHTIAIAIFADNAVALILGLIHFSRFIRLTIQLYVLIDEPVQETVGEWLESMISATTYCFTYAFVLQPGVTYAYLTRHLWEYDPACTWSLLVSTIAFWVWSSRSSRTGVFDNFYRLRNRLASYEGKLLSLRLWLQSSLRSAIVKSVGALQKKAINFEHLPTFEYHPLPENHIRLLRIKRRSIFLGLLDTSLIHVSLADAPEYEAMSYTWGEINPKQAILVNGHSFHVAPNLHALLLAHSSILRERLVWVDSLCINQENDDEKAIQVQLMREIYIGAGRVVAWLGNSYDAPLAARMIKNLITFKTIGLTGLNLREHIRMSEIGRPEWWAFRKQIQHSYFSRAWICQEAALARNMQFYIGGEYFSWQTVSVVMFMVAQPEMRDIIRHEKVAPEQEDLPFFQNWSLVLRLRAQERGTRISLGHILSASARFKAKYPVDKIYAMLGIANTDIKREIKPNYKKKADDVFLEVVQVLLGCPEDGVDILPHAGIGYPRKMSNLPSWVPDWASESERRSRILSLLTLPSLSLEKFGDFDPLNMKDILRRGLSHAVNKYDASGCSTASFAIKPGNKLRSTVVVVDTIKQMSTVLPAGRSAHETYVNWLHEVEQLATLLGAKSQQDQQSLEEATWRTLIADRTQEERPAPDTYALRFQIWKDFLETRGEWSLTDTQIEEYKRLLDPHYHKDRTSIESIYPVVGSVFLYGNRFNEACGGRRFCITNGGRMALVPPMTQLRDTVGIINGLQTPYILRPMSNDPQHRSGSDVDVEGLETFQLVGESYVHGIMDGQAIDKAVAQVVTFV